MKGYDPTVSAIWIFANLSYTGMRAQNTGSTFWRVVSFIFGFPGTLLTMLIVDEGSERAYGIDMPRRRVGTKRDLYETRGNPPTYQSGDQVRKDDQIIFQGEPGRVEFVAVAPGESPELKWYVEQYGGGVMITTSKGRAFLTRGQVAEGLVFISRSTDPGNVPKQAQRP
jgi:hypothetical protein